MTNAMVKGLRSWLASWIALGLTAQGVASPPELNEQLANYVAERELEFEQIPSERKEQLQQLAEYMRNCTRTDTPIKLTFICTHNSRRSHMAHLWAAVAATRYGIESVETFSGGTEVTAFNPRAVDAMRRAGFSIEKLDDSNNPKYRVVFSDQVAPQICFSKNYADAPNPARDFCAVMTCSSADQQCPNVQGARCRIAISYEDPKISDGTSGEAAKYNERSAQIAREMLYAFSLAR
jgi:arsenate reductase (thioredoxin)